MMKQLTLAVIAALGVAAVMTGGIAQAAPLAYQNAVQANNPFAYYRLQETGTLQDAPADNLGSSVTDGIYRGSGLVGGIAGAGTGSDTAVSFPGASNGSTIANLEYLRTTDAMAFGPQVLQSSYEVLFKSNVANPTTRQGLFGVVNADPDGAGPRTQLAGVQLELNTANANNVFSSTTTRMWVRDEQNFLVYANIPHGNLMDGNYHHFVVTVDLLAANLNDKIKAYIDGLPVDIDVFQSATTVTTDFQNFTRDPIFAGINIRGTVSLEANVTIDEAALYGSILSPSDVAAHATAAGYVVPEPGSLALVIAGLGLLSRRRKA